MGVLLFFIFQSSYGQPTIKPDFFDLDAPLQQPITEGVVHVVAVMVEFQPDDNRFTSGNGTFDLDYLNRDDIVIGPLPHDRAYFESHLEFARNYFSVASRGKVDLQYIVLPQVFRLPNEMKEYSPTGPDNSQNFKLGNLARDTWQLVAQSNLPDLSHLDPDKTLFIIFHAGAGRDIELVGTTLDNTPQDIPSVFLSKDAISRLTNNPAFDGFPLGDIRVTNSAILPQTQSRRGEDVTGTEFVLQLSINGILTANIGSFLGIPDLFNTSTGASGIGRFGLMDGAGIFSYFGLFPPLPSAWERYYMGWDTPFEISLDDTQPITLNAASESNTQTVARHSISADEYFLVENRHRDPNNSGVTLTFRLPDGSIETRTFDNEEERFSPFDQRKYKEILPAGVLINVSNFDWSLPGGLDAGTDQVVGTDDDRILNGGMLIWHIDEAVIRAKKPLNAINNNPDRPGVRLMEADGVQDIGRPSLLLTNFANGAPFDFWWSGNDFTVITASGQHIILYQNRFGDDTFPNNRSSSGSPTYFEFYDFSDNLPVATFRARRAQTGIADLIFETRLNASVGKPYDDAQAWPTGVYFYEQDAQTFLVIPTQNELLIFDLDDNYIPKSDIPIRIQTGVNTRIFTGGPLVIASQVGSSIEVSAWSWNSGTEQFDRQWIQSVSGSLNGFLSSDDGQALDLDTTPFRFSLQDGSPLSVINGGYQSGGSFGGVGVFIENGQLRLTDGTSIPTGNLTGNKRIYAGWAPTSNQGSPSIFLITDSEFSLLTVDGKNEQVIFESTDFSWPAMADVNNDGFLDFLFIDAAQNQLDARNINGARLWNFPKEAPRGVHYVGVPLLADITGDGVQEILVAATDSLSMVIRAYNQRLQLLDGFPLYVGSIQTEMDRKPLNIFFEDGILIAVAETGDVKMWSFENAGTSQWSSYNGGNILHKVRASVVGSNPVQGNFALLNKNETYNWPNPARNETWIRYETNGEASIEISVISMNGNRVFETTAHSRGNVPQEIYVNTSNWPSGVYYARVKATRDGRSETSLIKIAVMQ